MAFAAALTSSGCTPQPASPEAHAAQPIEITAIHWSSSNPSLGPYDQTSRASVHPGSFASPEAWNAAIATLLDQTQVNGVATLREYLVARRNEDAVRVATIEVADRRHLGAGGGNASVSFVIEGGASIEIGNLQRTRLSGEWSRFWESHLRDEIDRDAPRDAPLAPMDVKPTAPDPQP